jgi:SAM-dependent methyltransferase
MSAPKKTSQEPAHHPEEAARWFNQWHVYQAIVDANWMAHREIFNAVRTWVLLRYPGPFTLLDLGCGDAGFIKSTFDETGLWAYTGIDASQAALAKARSELAGAKFQVELREADMLAYLRADSSSAAKICDVILASYAVHHLPVQEKHEFFRLAHGKLAPRGSLLYADVFRRDGETREQYLEAYVGMMRRDWAGMPLESLASTTQHVMQRDFPESIEALAAMAREAGFQEPRELYRDATVFHRLLAFTKEAGA